MISVEQAEKAVDWLREQAKNMAQARAERIYLEQWIKTVKATLQAESKSTSAAQSEIEALSSPKYLAALQALKEAVLADEHNRFLAAAAEAKIEMFRTLEATKRAEGKAYG